MTIEVNEPGLRERKRLATRRSIQLTALRLVDERGLENVTVDEISRIADIAPRTFFNYFASKEEAIIGEGPALPTDASIAEFVASDDELFTSICRLITAASEQSFADHELSMTRRKVLKNFPHLFAVRMANMRHFEEELAAVVGRRLERSEPGLDVSARRSRALLVTLMSSAAMKHAWSQWADAPAAAELSVRLRESFEQMTTLLVAQNA